MSVCTGMVLSCLGGALYQSLHFTVNMNTHSDYNRYHAAGCYNFYHAGGGYNPLGQVLRGPEREPLDHQTPKTQTRLVTVCVRQCGLVLL